MKTPHLLLSALALLPWLLAPAAAEEEISVRALSFQPGFPPELHAHVPAGTGTLGEVQVKSFLNHEANLLKLPDRRIVFTLKSDPASATDINQRLATVDFPENLKTAILLFLPMSGKPGDFKSEVITIDDSASAFPPGSFKVVNLGTQTIKIELGTKVFECAPGKTSIIDKVPYGANQSVGMRAFCKRGDQWKLITTGAWSDPGTKRVLQIFTEDSLTKDMKLRGIRDVATP